MYVYNIYYIQSLENWPCLYSRAEIILSIVVPRFVFTVNFFFCSFTAHLTVTYNGGKRDLGTDG